jgi:hypothetical protein
MSERAPARRYEVQRDVARATSRAEVVAPARRAIRDACEPAWKGR